MAHRPLCLLLGIAALAALPFAIWAQSAAGVLQLIGTYEEQYLPNPTVSGNLLVGLRWGGPEDGSFNPAAVRVRLPGKLPTAKACVDVVSKDGRYSAENLYGVGVAAGRLARVAAPTSFAKQLEKYPVGDIAVMIRAVDSCTATDFGSVIPAIMAPLGAQASSDRGAILTAYVNADPGQVRADVLGPDKSVLAHSGPCKASGEGVRIAYSTTCTVELPRDLPTDGLWLRLTTRERFRSIPTDFRLIVSE